MIYFCCLLMRYYNSLQQKICEERGNVTVLLEKLSQEVADNGTFSTLTMWLEENTAIEKYRSEVKNRERGATAVVDHLQSKLDKVMEEHKQEMTKQRRTLTHLKEMIASAQDRETEEVNTIKKVRAVFTRCNCTTPSSFTYNENHH